MAVLEFSKGGFVEEVFHRVLESDDLIVKGTGVAGSAIAGAVGAGDILFTAVFKKGHDVVEGNLNGQTGQAKSTARPRRSFDQPRRGEGGEDFGDEWLGQTPGLGNVVGG